MWLAVLAGIYLSFGGALLYFVGGQLPEITESVGFFSTSTVNLTDSIKCL